MTMKKNFKFMLLGLLAMGGMNAFAQTIDEAESSHAGILYELTTNADETKTAVVVGINPKTADAELATVSIPAEVTADKGTYKVVSMVAGWWAAAGKKDASALIETLNIDGTNFNAGALDGNFAGLTKLKNLKIVDNGGATAADKALTAFPTFADKTIVETVDIANCTAVTSVYNEAFYDGVNKGALTSIALPSSILTIGKSAFTDCTKLTTVNFPDALTDIGVNAFKNTAITAADLTNTDITKIKYGAFQNTKLTSFVVPAAVTQIQGYAFCECSKLASVTFEENAVCDNIEAYAFAFTAIEEFTLNNGYVEDYAFQSCMKLKKFNFVDPDVIGGDYLESDAFIGCIPDVTIYTPQEYIDAYPIAPTNCVYEAKAAPVKIDGSVAFSSTGFAKWYSSDINIAVDASKYKAFSVYVDNGEKNGDGTAYFIGLMKTDGRYYIPAGTHVVFQKIVTDEKDAASTKVQYEEVAVMAKPLYSVLKDHIFTFEEDCTISQFQMNNARVWVWDNTTLAPDWWYSWWESDQYLYRLSAKGGLGFSYFSGTDLKGGYGADSNKAQFFIQSLRKPDASGRLNVVWVEDGNTTAIESVKTSTEDGAIYNLAGQKVNANYKGVVIKNGKKIMK
jgi:hypothetical protein